MNQTAHPITTVADSRSRVIRLVHGLSERQAAFKPTPDCWSSAAVNGDVHRAIQSGKYTLEGVSREIGEVLSGQRVGRSSAEAITIAKFVGILAQDLDAGEEALQLASYSCIASATT